MIYDLYGMEGLISGLELGSKLNKVDEIKEELERLQRRKEEEKIAAHFRPSGSILANLSLPRFLRGDGILRGYNFLHSLFSTVPPPRLSFYLIASQMEVLFPYTYLFLLKIECVCSQSACSRLISCNNKCIPKSEKFSMLLLHIVM